MYALIAGANYETDREPFSAFTPPAAAVLGRAFSAACNRDTPGTASELHNATASFVTRLKQSGAPPERVIVAIKDALTRYGTTHLPPSFISDENTLGERRAIMYRHVFDWCLDAFYGPT